MMKLNIHRADIKKNMRRFVALTHQILIQARPGELLKPAPFLEVDSSTYLMEKAQNGMSFLLKIQVTDTFFAIVNCLHRPEGDGQFGGWTCVADCFRRPAKRLRMITKDQGGMKGNEPLSSYRFRIG